MVDPLHGLNKVVLDLIETNTISPFMRRGKQEKRHYYLH